MKSRICHALGQKTDDESMVTFMCVLADRWIDREMEEMREMRARDER